MLAAGATIRLTREAVGTPAGSEGRVLGWYANDPTTIVVMLWDGGVQRVPLDALELVEPRPAESG